MRRHFNIEGMWVLLPIVSILIPATVGNLETDSVRVNIIQLENGNNDTLDDRMGKSAIVLSKEWKKDESFSTGRNKKQTDPNNASDEMKGNENLHSIEDNERRDSAVKIVAKRGEVLRSWFDSSANDKSSNQGREDPWIYWWGDKKHNKQITIRRSIPASWSQSVELPSFHYWYGKRGQIGAQSKRTKPMYSDGDDKDAFMDRYNAKREAEIEKVRWIPRFGSWNGKRAQKWSNQESNRQLLMKPNPDVYLKETAVQMKPEIRAIFDEWERKCNNFPCDISLHEINEKNKNDYMTRDEIANANGNDNHSDNWLTVALNKKGETIPSDGVWYRKKDTESHDRSKPQNVDPFFCPWCG
ncbi:uncharacterized protein LOC143177028 isoform X2 [Calliopsis andreniformis]|uniref:uncharacterized protein LOC143177028 isoform X2 n=1 Tax=Calliopsis andreniformis TaxID=337506 RepID=UPI003FCD0406